MARFDPLQSSAFWLRIIERYLDNHTDELQSARNMASRKPKARKFYIIMPT